MKPENRPVPEPFTREDPAKRAARANKASALRLQIRHSRRDANPNLNPNLNPVYNLYKSINDQRTLKLIGMMREVFCGTEARS